MRLSRVIVILLLSAVADANLLADTPAYLDPHLECLRPLIDKTWKGEFKNSKPDKPIIDVSRWERALNGKAVRMLHSINDGAYGGETIFVWDEKKQTVAYHYFTTAGFMTTGTLEAKDGKVLTSEHVSGATGGVTEVRGTSEIRADGTFHVKTEHLKDGEWSPGHEVTYREAPEAKVVFK
ncbi:MAG TPA: hypothetical protein VJA21_04990 [Verrucomicrobiae bacterium]